MLALKLGRDVLGTAARASKAATCSSCHVATMAMAILVLSACQKKSGKVVWCYPKLLSVGLATLLYPQNSVKEHEQV
jgi:hypothetical protein